MAIKQNIFLDQGTTFELDIGVYDENGDVFDLSNYDSRAKFRKHWLSVNSHSFVTSLNVSSGTVTLTMNAESTANVDPGRYMYDVEIYNDDTDFVFRVAEGILTITPEITK